MHDLAAERALALTLVHDPKSYDYCADVLRAEMFGSEQARAVFEGVVAVVRSQQPVTPVTVQAALLAAGRAGSAIPGWAKGSPVSTQEAVTLAARIRELWARRTLAAAAGEVSGSALENESAKGAARLAEVLAEVQSGGSGKARAIQALVYDWMMELEDEAKNPDARPVFYETGFRSLDLATGGLARGELSVFAARPGSGKSSFMIALAANIAAAGTPVGMFWLEDDWRDAARRFLARRLQCEAWRLRGHPAKAVNYVAGFPGFIEKSDLPLYVDDTHGLTITDVQARMRRMHRENGVRVFILDHLGEVRIEKDERWGDRHDLALGRVAREYRDTAKQLGAVPILVSQMNRRWEQRGADSVPQMSDLDGSGQVEQAARLIAFLRMEKNADGSATGRGALNVVKATGGQPGTVDLEWDGRSMTWNEAKSS